MPKLEATCKLLQKEKAEIQKIFDIEDDKVQQLNGVLRNERDQIE